jgi:hypothetical protein
MNLSLTDIQDQEARLSTARIQHELINQQIREGKLPTTARAMYPPTLGMPPETHDPVLIGYDHQPIQ